MGRERTRVAFTSLWKGEEDVTARGGGHCEGPAEVGLTTLVTNHRRVHGVLTTLTKNQHRTDVGLATLDDKAMQC